MIANTYVYGFTGTCTDSGDIPLSFCDLNVINHFYCDDVPLVALACSDTHVKELMLLIIAGFNTLCFLLIVLISYGFIFFAILWIHSAEGRQKAFSTCFPPDLHHNILWNNHFYIPAAQVKPFPEYG